MPRPGEKVNKQARGEPITIENFVIDTNYDNDNDNNDGDADADTVNDDDDEEYLKMK